MAEQPPVRRRNNLPKTLDWSRRVHLSDGALASLLGNSLGEKAIVSELESEDDHADQAGQEPHALCGTE